MDPIILTVQGAGNERGIRLYFNSKDLRKMKERFGERFFIFRSKKLVANIDPVNETIIISSLGRINTTRPNKSTIDEELYFLESIEDTLETDEEEVGTLDQTKLDFYMPMDGTGDEYWVAEVLIKDNFVFYCVSESKNALEKEIKRISNKHFPGLLDLKNVNLEFFKANLVYSPVSGFIAQNAIKKIMKKKIKNVEIKSSISIPNDAELTPIVDIGKGNLRGKKVRKRDILAKYEIVAIASQLGSVKNALVKEIGDKFFWQITTNNGDLFFDPINGDKINDSLIKELKESIAEAPLIYYV